MPRLKSRTDFKRILLFAMVAVILTNFYLAVLAIAQNIEMLTQWSRHPAEITSLAYENEIEVPTTFADIVPDKKVPEYCFAYQEGNTCLLLPNNPYSWFSSFDQVEVLQNPKQPKQVEILSMTGLWLPVAGNALFIILPIAAWRWISRSGWGEDRTWRDGAWVTTASTPQRIGYGAMDAEPVKETAASRKAVVFWNVLFLIIAAIAVPSAVIQMSSDPLQALFFFIAGGGMLLLALYSAAKTFSRVIYQDSSGLVDCSFFGIKRIPWTAVANVKLVNLNQAAQRRYDRSHDFSDERPETLNVYVVSDRQEREILRLGETMAPAAAFTALLNRLQRQGNMGERHVSTEDNPHTRPAPGVSQTESQTDFAAEWDRMTKAIQGRRKSLFHRDNRGLLMGLLAMLAPFVLITAYLAYQSVWFKYAAERAQGQVVEIKRDPLPSLVVAYHPAHVDMLRIESDGSDAYGGFQVGDKISVCYDADDPENARLDLFLELWLGTLIMGGLTVIVLLAAVLIGRSLTSPFPMSRL